MTNERGGSGGGGISAQVLVGVLTAVIVGLLGLFVAWASQGGLVHFLGGMTKDEGVTKDDFKAAVGDLKATVTSPLSRVTVQRFGAKGRILSLVGVDQGDYTAANNDTLVASRKEFPICAVTTIAVKFGANGATPQYCTLLSPQDEWRIYVSGDVGCMVTCFK
jgi:hypothetical protein